MGIKNLNNILRKKCPKAFKETKISNITNKRIAIDTPLWLYTNMSTIIKHTVNRMKNVLDFIDRKVIMNQVLLSALKFHFMLVENNITPVWLLDGKTPIEKAITRSKRKSTRTNRKTLISELKEKINTQDIFMRSTEDVKELKKLMQNDVNILPEEFDIFYNVLHNLGIPIIVSPGEAEAYGAAMNKKNLIYGVWTTDTDSYALEAINIITGYGDRIDNEQLFNVVHIPTILKNLELDSNSMRDFCIMCGTDFNDNIANIGPTRSLNYIQQHTSIENFQTSTNINCDILNYERTRVILSPPECLLNHKSVSLYHNSELFNSNYRTILNQYQLNEIKSTMIYHMNRTIPVEKFSRFPIKFYIEVEEVEKEEVEKEEVEKEEVEKKTNTISSLAELLLIMQKECEYIN